MPSILKNKIVFNFLLLFSFPIICLALRDGLSHFGFIETPKEVALGRDFINYFNSSLLILSDDVLRLFDTVKYWEFIKDYHGEDMSFHNWSYPPHIWLFTWPLGLLPYIPSLLIWSALSCLLFFFAAKLHTFNTADAIILLLAPAGLICLLTGQNGLLTSAIFVSAFALKDRRPRLAGILIGCLTVKPQLGIFIPIVLILMRDWKVIFWAGVSTVTLVGSSILLFGLEPWEKFLHEVLPLQVLILESANAPFSYMVPSFFMGLKLLGVPMGTAKTLHFICTFFVVGIVVWAFWKKRNYDLQLAVLFTGTVLFSPYIVNYDLSILTMAAYLYYRYLVQSGKTMSRYSYYLVGFVATAAINTFILSSFGIYATSLVIMFFMWVLTLELASNVSTVYSKPIIPKLSQII